MPSAAEVVMHQGITTHNFKAGRHLRRPGFASCSAESCRPIPVRCESSGTIMGTFLGSSAPISAPFDYDLGGQKGRRFRVAGIVPRCLGGFSTGHARVAKHGAHGGHTVRSLVGVAGWGHSPPPAQHGGNVGASGRGPPPKTRNPGKGRQRLAIMLKKGAATGAFHNTGSFSDSQET